MRLIVVLVDKHSSKEVDGVVLASRKTGTAARGIRERADTVREISDRLSEEIGRFRSV
jgi:hypothetical protein